MYNKWYNKGNVFEVVKKNSLIIYLFSLDLYSSYLFKYTDSNMIYLSI